MKRRGFQVHLSTAIVMMFMAGSALWLNFQWFDDRPEHLLPRWRGWPVAAYIAGFRGIWNYSTNEVESIEYIKWQPWGLIIDSVVGFLIVLGSGMLVEYKLIRRREQLLATPSNPKSEI